MIAYAPFSINAKLKTPTISAHNNVFSKKADFY